MTAPEPNDDDLGALADGQLDATRRAEVEAAVALDPALAARLAAVRRQNASLRDAFDPWLGEALPPRLLDAAKPPASTGALARRWPAFAIAATLLVGLAVGWYARDQVLVRDGTPTSFARQAAYTHAIHVADRGRPVEVWANEEASLVRWLTRRVGHPARVPDLKPLGFQLVGGRLVGGHEKPTGLVMYENADKERLTLQWRVSKGSSGETEFRYAHEGGVSTFYWFDDDAAYALSGPFDRAKMLGVARVVYGQLAEPLPPAAPALPAAPVERPKTSG